MMLLVCELKAQHIVQSKKKMQPQYLESMCPYSCTSKKKYNTQGHEAQKSQFKKRRRKNVKKSLTVIMYNTKQGFVTRL